MREYDINLGVGEQLKDILVSRGYNVIMTREDNQTLSSSKERARKVKEEDADIFVRIFCRKQRESVSNGAMIYLPSEANPYIGYMFRECYLLGNAILSNYCYATGFENRGIYLTDVTKGINWSTMPVAQIMLGCINDEGDEERLADQDNWFDMAAGIANGIDEYFESKEM